MTRTPIQTAILAAYRFERRMGLDPCTAARMVRGAFADDIAVMAVHGASPSRAQLDRYRVAEQWYMTLLARQPRPVVDLVRGLRDANRQEVA
jgi:hypothetical protein